MRPAWRGKVKLGAFWSRAKLVSTQRLVPARAAWSMNENPYATEVGKRLLAIEKVAAKDILRFTECAREFAGPDEVDAVGTLNTAAVHDLVAGCELARLGFMKQAYTLWRSWFEQAMFALYFIESPIHRQAWKVSESIKIGDKPAHRLMLHQLLQEGSEKHPFIQVYVDRYEALTASLKISNIPKNKKIAKRAELVLTVLSQGVHGTFRPLSPGKISAADSAIEKYGLDVLQEAIDVVAVFWICYLVSLMGIDDSAIAELKVGALNTLDPSLFGINGADKVVALNESFSRIFGG